MSPPTSPQVKAAEELELPDDGASGDEKDDFQGPPISPAPAPASPSPDPPAMAVAATTPVRKVTPSPSRVKAAAAMFEQSDTTPTRPTKLSPSTSFRSISATSIRTSPQKRSPEKLAPVAIAPESPSPPASKIALASPPQILTQPPRDEAFAEVPLSAGQGTSFDHEPVSIAETASYSLSPVPPPADVYASLPEPVVTPPAAKEEPRKAGFFSSALGFGTSPAPTPSPAAGSSTVTPVTSTPASRSVSSTSQAGSGWRTTMSSLFVSRNISATSPVMESTSPAEMTPASSATTPGASASSHAGPSRQQSATSAAFILNRMSSTTASRDRRISKELGGGDKLREGFERVRNEMEGAAREMRRERQATANSSGSGTDSSQAKSNGSGNGSDEASIDWTFWGAVVQDYEGVAVAQPKELSKAIQHGIPPVIR